MAPKPDITVSMNSGLIDDLEALADIHGTHRSAEISAASMAWVNVMIRNGVLDRDYLYDVEAHHADSRSLV